MKYNGLLIVLALIYTIILSGNSLDTNRINKVDRQNQGERIITENKYSIKSASFRQCTEDKLINIDISFPQIVGMEDAELQDKINKSLYSKCVKQDDKVWDGIYYELKADFEIKYADKDVVSIVFPFESTYISQSFNRKFGMNIDMNTGELIPLDDYISKKELDILLDNTNNEKIHTDSPYYEEHLQNKRTLKILYENSPIYETSEAQIYSYYLTKDKVVILFDTDVVSDAVTIGIEIPRKV